METRPADNASPQNDWYTVFPSLEDFARAVEKETNTPLDFKPIMKLHTDFLQSADNYLLLNVKQFSGGAEENDFLFLSRDKAYILTNHPPRYFATAEFAEVLRMPFGKSTILAFIVLNRLMGNHKKRFEELLERVQILEETFEHREYHDLVFQFERFDDRLEEFHDLMLRLQESRFKEVQTRYIAFDYGVLITESLSLQGRCRRRLTLLQELRQDHELQSTEELNRRIIKLNDVVRKLTALTVILMMPTLVASHFGMNFVFMPELKIAWAYPAVIIVQLVLMAIGAFIFRKIGWL